MSISPLWLIAGAIILFAVIGQVRQTLKSRQSVKALKGTDTTAILRGTDGMHITEVDGHDLFVDEIALTPGVHKIGFQVSKFGGIVNIPPTEYQLHTGMTLRIGRARRARTYVSPCDAPTIATLRRRKVRTPIPACGWRRPWRAPEIHSSARSGKKAGESLRRPGRPQEEQRVSGYCRLERGASAPTADDAVTRRRGGYATAFRSDGNDASAASCLSRADVHARRV